MYNTIQQVQVDRSSESEVAAASSSPKERERHSLCWNFPRVKLKQIFNAKSLDDILGRNQSLEQRKESQDSQTVRVPISTRRTTHSPSTHLQPSSSEILQEGIRPRSSSSQSPQPSSNNEDTLRSPARLSSSSSNIKIEHREFRYAFPLTPQVLSNSSSEDNCYLTSSYLQVPQGRSSGTTTGLTLMEPGSAAKVSCAKSDNCINRVVTTFPTASIIKPPHNSVNDIPGPSLPRSSHFPIPTIVRHSPEHSKTRKKIHFLSNKVEPSGKDSKMTGTKQNGGEGPKLVVASVAYLQRPASPSCVPTIPMGFSVSDPSGSGMRSPASGSRTPQALLSPTVCGFMPSPTVFRPSPGPATGPAPGKDFDQSTRTISSSSRIEAADGKSRTKSSPSPHGFFTSCCRSPQSISTQDEEDDRATVKKKRSKDNKAHPQPISTPGTNPSSHTQQSTQDTHNKG